MKTSADEISQRYMVLIKIDATNLYNRIKERKNQYIETFSLKRDRSIFREIFSCRYSKGTLFDLSHLPVEIIEVSNDFYTEVNELLWYLMHTQDMPNTIEDEISHYLHLINKKYEVLLLYIDAELSGTKVADLENAEDIPALDSADEFFVTQGETQAYSEETPFIDDSDDS